MSIYAGGNEVCGAPLIGLENLILKIMVNGYPKMQNAFFLYFILKRFFNSQKNLSVEN